MRKAAAAAPKRVGEALRDFRQLNSRDARAAFADHWIGLWARDFDEAWPMVYELLQIVEQEKLYADPRRVGPDAAGGSETHGDVSAYASFAEYFEDRVKRSFETWSELEGTYHYAQRYAPDLLTKAFNLARTAKERATQGAKALARAIKNDGLVINNESGLPRNDDPENLYKVKITDDGALGGNRAVYLTRRIARDHPDVLDRMASGEFPSVRAAAIEAGIAPRTQTIRVDDPESAARTIRAHMSADTRHALARLLMDD